MPNSTGNSTNMNDIYNSTKFIFLVQLQLRCFQENITHSQVLEVYNGTETDDGALWCNRTFDGLACWDETPPSSTAYQSCPEIAIGFDPRRLAYKFCFKNATWSSANYSNCVDLEDLAFRSAVNILYVVGYSLSVAALVMSILIFSSFRALKLKRLRIHVHLFISFAMNNILWIAWYLTVINDVSVVISNTVWCQLLHILTMYFMVTSYSWMSCEGLHLHSALVVVFIKDKIAMYVYVALGWGVPMLVVGAYAITRIYMGETDRCWLDLSDYFWIIVVPVTISMIASFIFLVRVIRVLITKIRPIPNHPAYVEGCKATRATCLLIPLLGLHLFLLPLRPLPHSPGERIYQVVAALLISLQGLGLSILFCYTNHEVLNAIKAFRDKRRRTIECTAVVPLGASQANTRETGV